MRFESSAGTKFIEFGGSVMVAPLVVNQTVRVRIPFVNPDRAVATPGALLIDGRGATNPTAILPGEILSVAVV